MFLCSCELEEQAVEYEEMCEERLNILRKSVKKQGTKRRRCNEGI